MVSIFPGRSAVFVACKKGQIRKDGIIGRDQNSCRDQQQILVHCRWTFNITLYTFDLVQRYFEQCCNYKKLTRAPLGYFYNAPHWGGGGLFRAPPPLISETTGTILKIQAALESPGKTVEGKQILLTSGSRVTSQVRSKSKCSTFRAWWHRRAKLRC